MLDPDQILYAVLIFSWAEFAFEWYLGKRQRRIYNTHLTVPEMLQGILDQETFEKARSYALDKASFGAVQSVFSQTLSTLIIWFYGFKYVWDAAGDSIEALGASQSDEIYRSMVMVFYFNVFNLIVAMPFTIYSTFVLEQKHGFNKQTPGFFVKDQIKKFLVGQAITMPLIAAIIKIIQIGGDFFFIYLWGFVFVFTIIMMVIYPEFIAPLFDKYTPLPDGELRSEIEALAASIEFPLYKLFVVEGSKRSSHSNAYFYGFFKFKRIVLFDTLLEASEREKLKELEKDEDKDEDKDKDNATEAKSDKEEDDDMKKKGCNTPEILAVLGHELGHWKMNHVLKNLIIAEVHIFLMFALFGYLYKNQDLYTAFGFASSQPVLIGLMIIMQFITAPYNALLDFLMTCLSRYFEFQADAFAVGLGRAKELKTALIKLNNDNLGFPIYDWMYSSFHHSHPPLLQRIAALEELANKRKKD